MATIQERLVKEQVLVAAIMLAITDLLSSCLVDAPHHKNVTVNG